MTGPGHAEGAHEPDEGAHEHAAHEHGDEAHEHGDATGGGHDHDDDGHHDHAGHDHGDGDGGHDHAHAGGIRARLLAVFRPHSHDAGDAVDAELETSRRGIRALVASFIGLAVTALLQGVVVTLSGSVGLLGDTLHNAADALTAIPLAIAFTLGRRAATSRYTYGYGRSEDLAGLLVVLLILASSAVAAAASIARLVHPQGVDRLPLVAVASLVGFAGNEIVARYRIRVGREIGSAALVADGLHARTDGLTSLAVLVGAGGVALGFRLADPIVGLVITVAILVVLRQAAREVFSRLMDAVDPALVGTVTSVLLEVDGVRGVGEVRLRWIGHALRAECDIAVAPELSVVAAHHIAEEAQHELLHRVRRLTAVMVHADPVPAAGQDHHRLSAHHRAPLTGPPEAGAHLH